jgi:Flp pilus assembly protein TadD
MPRKSRSRSTAGGGRSAAAGPAARTVSVAARPRRLGPTAGICLLLVLLVAVAYAPAVRCDFVNYDDPAYVSENRVLAGGFSWHGVAWAFTTLTGANWHPVTWLSHMLDCQLFGLDPGWHHAVSVALHAASAVLLFLACWRMTRARWPSAMLAALFALHPLHVESVAWLSERKDVLSTFFFMLTLLAYSFYVQRPSVARYGLVALSTALGLMSKPMLVTLPLVLLLLDYWPLGRFSAVGGSPAEGGRSAAWGKRALWLGLEKLPLLALAAASATITLIAQSRMGATKMLGGELTLAVRLGNAIVAYAAYLGMALWPARLAVFYPYIPDRPAWQIAASAVLILVLTAAAIGPGTRWMRRRPYLAVGWFWYLATLVPVLGLVQVGAQSMADRYTYIPLIGVFLAAVWGVADVAARCRAHACVGIPSSTDCEAASGTRSRTVLTAAAVAILLGCLLLTNRQVRYWTDSEALFRRALAVTPDNPVAHEGLGDALLRQGRDAEAEVEFRRVLRLDAEHYLQTPCELAKALNNQGRPEEAVACLREVVRAHPENARAQNDLAMLLARRGQVGEAIALLREALRLEPDRPEGMHNLAWILATCPDRRFRDGPEAVELARRACDLCDRQNPQYLRTLADAYVESGELAQAEQELQAALGLKPQDADTHWQLGKVLEMLDRPLEAAQHFQAAQRLKAK